MISIEVMISVENMRVCVITIAKKVWERNELPYDVRVHTHIYIYIEREREREYHHNHTMLFLAQHKEQEKGGRVYV